MKYTDEQRIEMLEDFGYALTDKGRQELKRLRGIVAKNNLDAFASAKVTSVDIEDWERKYRQYIEEYEWKKLYPKKYSRLNILKSARNCLSMAIKCRESKIISDHCE